VTALREHPRRAGRYVVELSEEPDRPEGSPAGARGPVDEDPDVRRPRIGPLDAAVLGELRVAVGGDLTPEVVAALKSAARRVACYDKALDALARRVRSGADLGRWLRQRDFGAAEIEPTLEKLTELGLLNDLEFARGFARSRMAGRGFGPRRVAAELARRRVARSVVDAVLSEVAGEGETEPAELLDALVARRMQTMRQLDPGVARRRVYAWLARRGFGVTAIRDAVRRYETKA
jgi:regulatory protein